MTEFARPTIPTSSSAPSRGRRVGWAVMTFFATLLALFVVRYFGLDPDSFFPQQRGVYLAHEAPLLLHIGGSAVALALGPWQFVRRIRTRWPRVHRVVGRTYVASALVGGVGGLLLAPLTYTGPVAALGFAALAVGLIGTTVTAFVAIRRRQIDRHRAWMTRSYALIFVGVSFRLWLATVPALGLTFEQAYASGAWAAWIINLAVAEVLIRRTRRRG